MISDNDLLLYYYRDGLDAAERARIAAALSEQPELAARLHRLVARLDVAAGTADVPVPEHVQQRWQSALDRAAKGEAPRQAQPRAHWFANAQWRMAAAAAGVIVLVVGVKIGMQPAADRVAQAPSPEQTQTDSSAASSMAYERGLRWHLANTEWQLASLDTTSGEERSRLVETIIAQNRLYAIAAERANEPQLARVLRSFTPILERLADDRGDDSAGEIAQLNFELNAMQARLNAATATESTARSLAL